MAMSMAKMIAELRCMAVGQLREKYLEVFGEPTRAGNKDFLFKRIAWRIQALAEGDLSVRARRRAEFLARDADVRTTAPKAPAAARGGNGVLIASQAKGAKSGASVSAAGDGRVPPPGTVLTRPYRGQAFHVIVRDDGFEYDGQLFRSLSAIAKLITGSHWNGLLFFGLAKAKGRREAANA